MQRLRSCVGMIWSQRGCRQPSFIQMAGVQRRMAHDGFERMNFYKDPAAAPKEMEDGEYPDWLWKLQEVQPTKEELFRMVQREYEKGGFDAVFANVDEEKLRRLFRLHQKMVIKEENNRRKGGRV
eukprot:GFKZ01006269.1.p1 GENE.GFKZ01006269.1~~GFKZ01006269.1.p1  ORF type:complete len:125 (+),score=19.05 GFKZ01006269.1:122-496(+)